MDYYNSKDFTTMQEEAVNRVKEMQRRSKNMVNGGEQRKAKAENSTRQAGSTENQQQKHVNPLQSLLGVDAGSTTENNGLFNIAGIKIDEEKALIGILIYILYKQGADIKLMLALGYLLL